MVFVGVVVALIVGFTVSWSFAAVAGWGAACIVYIARVWAVVWGMDAAQTKSHATAEDPTRAISDLMVLIASVASLVAVVVILVRANSSHGVAEGLIATFAVVSVALSWILIHTLYTLRYAGLYYGVAGGGVDFNQKAPPRYSDFAYLSFTLGMTFQVSDTNIGDSIIRRTILRHTLLSYVFGSVILATTVNLVAGLAS